MSRHFDNLMNRAPALESCRDAILEAFSAMKEAFADGKKLLLCGNGGSAADADHWAGELLKGFYHKRPLTGEERRGIPTEIADRLQRTFPVIPLTSFPALHTAFGNDVDPHLIFAQLVLGLGAPGDVLVGISTSGNAKNVGAAVQVAKAKGLKTIALTGEGGGKLAPLCDIAIRVPARETYLIQEYHLPVYHCLCLMLEEAFFPES